jgi:hypothetical protein
MDSEDDEAWRPGAASGSWSSVGRSGGAWHDDGSLTSRPARARRWGTAAGFVFLGLVIVGCGGAFGADAYATQAICAAVGRTGPARAPDGVARDTAVALDRTRRSLDETATLLFFHPELRDATRGLADDLADMRLLRDAGDVTGKLLVVAVSVDTHARQAQSACGLPADGVRNAAAAPKSPFDRSPRR